MCGIIGLMNFGQQIDESFCRRFEMGLGLMRGQGPDGYWVYADHEILMAQTVLLITDPANGIQPYISNDLNIVACANGEIYNDKELRTELEEAGASFRSNSDCEVIAHGYARWREGLFERLDGMFAIAVFDRKNRVLTIARDKVGIRPLYYTYQNDYVAFASEPRLLTAAGFASTDPCEEGLFHSLVLRRALEPVTMYKDVRAVLPGQLLTFESKHQNSKRIFASIPPQMRPSQNNLAPNINLDLLRVTVTEAVKRRVPTECKYSLFLSGGLDSTIVNRLTPKDPERRLPSMVSGFSFANMVDERLMAQKAARLVETELITRSVSLDRFLAIWPLLVWANSEPLMFNSSVPLFLLCREAYSRLGAKVILSGEGADEMFVGYSQYPAYKQYEDDGTPEYLFRYDDEIIPLDLVFGEWLRDKQWGIRQWGMLQDRINTYVPFKGKKHGLARKLEFDRITFMRGLLMRQDRVGLTSSVEIRVPFLDSKVLQEATKYPANWHLSNGVAKQLLRQAFEPDITKELAKTPKIGFPVPVDRWLIHSNFKSICMKLNEYLNQTEIIKKDAILDLVLSSKYYPKNSYRKIWTLLNLSMWWITKDAPLPPHGIWADILPKESHRDIADIVADTRYAFPPGSIYKSLAHQQRPVVIRSNKWQGSEVSQF